MICSIYQVLKSDIITFIGSNSLDDIKSIIDSNPVTLKNLSRFYDWRNDKETFYDSKLKLEELCNGTFKNDELSYTYGYLYLLICNHFKKNILLDVDELFLHFFLNSEISKIPSFFIKLPENENMPLVVSVENSKVLELLNSFEEFLLSKESVLENKVCDFLRTAIQNKLDIVISAY